jgi:hypothetical protein
MSASNSRKARAYQQPKVSAQPRPLNDLSARWMRDELATSVDSDQLGARFLNEATEQSNFESRANELPELSLRSGPATDDPLTNASFDPERSVWEQTVALTSDEEIAAYQFDDDERWRAAVRTGRTL